MSHDTVPYVGARFTKNGEEVRKMNEITPSIIGAKRKGSSIKTLKRKTKKRKVKK